MESVFISSLARGEIGAIREAARHAVESLGMRPVMFETTPASNQSPRRLLLDRVADCDVLLLLLGAEYGEPVARGVSPTEEEFNEAREHGVPVLAVMQNVAREPAQDEFIRRVRGSWEGGKFAPEFHDPVSAVSAVVAALNAWRNAKPEAESRGVAESRALELARGTERNTMTSGSKLRVVITPLTRRLLLDAVTLDQLSLPDDLASAARASGVVTNDMAITTTVDRDDAIRLEAKGGGWETLNLLIGPDGAVVAEAPVGGSQQNFGGSVVMHDRVGQAIERAAAFALAVWQRIDRRDDVQQALIVASVPEAEYKVYALVEPVGSMSMGSMGRPAVLIAPATPLLVRREDLAGEETVERLRAEIKRRFAADNAVHTG